MLQKIKLNSILFFQSKNLINFMTTSEMCGHGQKFYNYCSSVVDGVKEISDYFSKV